MENKEKNSIFDLNSGSRDSFDDFYGLDRMFDEIVNQTDPGRARAGFLPDDLESLKQRDDSTREKEMQSIREDIERRYSQQVEQAQANADVAQPEKETVIEEIAAEESEPVKNEPEKDESWVEETSAFYLLIYALGLGIIRSVQKFCFALVSLAAKPYTAIVSSLEKASNVAKKRFGHSIVRFVADLVSFRREIGDASRHTRRESGFFAKMSAFNRSSINAAKRHKRIFITALNIILPIVSLVVFSAMSNYWNSVTFALEVTYDGNSVGYISNESVYIEAQELVRQRLDTGAYGSTTDSSVVKGNYNADYKLTLVSLDELNDAQTICDEILTHSVDNLTNACGVYIDGDFVCAVKNEADAKTAFESVLLPYTTDNRYDNDYVGFVETIDYVEGLYSDVESIVWDASKLQDQLANGERVGQKVYTVQKNDSIGLIANRHDVTESYLRNANPGYDWNKIQPGDVIVVSSSVPYINVKVVRTTTYEEDVAFNTIKRKDSTKYVGYSSVVQQGVEGLRRVTKTETIVGGVVVDVERDYETIREPVDKIVTVGSKTYGIHSGSVNMSSKGFLWPAPSCNYVSSAYGWRSRGWHSGIDLIRSGGGANGTAVIASKAGRVEVVQYSNSGYGNMILINHGDGYKTRYAHLLSGSITVSTGEYVYAGQVIGKVGSTGNSTGPHLHYEVIYNGATQNPAYYISYR